MNKIISTKIKEVDQSNVVSNKPMTIEESIEHIKKSFQYEDDKTLMNYMIQKLNESK
jgi:hypothetical protein